MVRAGLDGSVKQASHTVNLNLAQRIIEVCDGALGTLPVHTFPTAKELDRARDHEDYYGDSDE